MHVHHYRLGYRTDIDLLESLSFYITKGLFALTLIHVELDEIESV
jgi:hypothetical protein